MMNLRVSGMRKLWIVRVCILLARPLFIATLLIVVGKGLGIVMGWALPEGSGWLNAVEVTLNVAVFGSAVVLAIGGFAFLVWDTFRSLWRFIQEDE